MKIALAAAPGGHLAEIIALRPAYEQFDHFFVLNRNRRGADPDLGRIHWVPDYGVGGRFTRLAALARLGTASMSIWLRERPDVLISTGPFTGFPLALLVRAAGGRVIYIECSAQVAEPSKSGRAFHVLSNSFYVQWPFLEAKYRRAKYRGLLL